MVVFEDDTLMDEKNADNSKAILAGDLIPGRSSRGISENA